jgi:hypothetical protein
MVATCSFTSNTPTVLKNRQVLPVPRLALFQPSGLKPIKQDVRVKADIGVDFRLLEPDGQAGGFGDKRWRGFGVGVRGAAGGLVLEFLLTQFKKGSLLYLHDGSGLREDIE